MATTGSGSGPAGFSGFTPEALQFLADLAEHNDRAWFTPRKGEFERLLKAPMEALCTALADAFPRHGVPLTADPKRSPFRIHRDTRFSKDKTPYKVALSAGFGWADEPGTANEGDAASRQGARGGRASGEAGGAGGYFHLQPGEVYLGGGMWHPEPARLAAFRRLVDSEPGRVLAAVEDAAFLAEFGAIEGERLSRVPQGYAKDHPRADLLRLKDVVFSRRLSDEEVFSPDLPEAIAASLAAATPVFRLLGSVTA